MTKKFLSSKKWFKKPKLKDSDSCPNSHTTTFQNYIGFPLYFFGTDDADVNKIQQHVSVCERFISQNDKLFSVPDIRRNKAFFIDLQQVSEDYLFNSEWAEFSTVIVSNTEYCLSCFGLAMHQKVVQDLNDKNVPFINTRITNHQPVINIKNLKVNSLGMLVSVRGTVNKTGTAHPLYKYVTFACSSCSGLQTVSQPDGVFTPVTKCQTKGCRAQSNFTACITKSNRMDCQMITLQDMGGGDYSESTHVPRTVECELTDDLVGCCSPGDDVTITGIVKVQNAAELKTKKNQPSVFVLFLFAITVVNNKNQGEASNGSLERITFNTRDYYAIQKIHAEPNLFRLLVQSLCPSIYGHEVVKAGLLLALFGGTHNTKGDIVIRSASHVLMVGDPGLGKSQILQACTNVSPRGVYVCGNTSSNCGLTVMITKEASGDYSLEAGALLLANQGNCCIDEFDKMINQHSCLLEAMEQQSISIAKAGVTCSLAASASILAAANPVDGHYNKGKTVSENIRLSAPLISRFDLVFIILDQPCEQYDALISEHVLSLHLGLKQNLRDIPPTLSNYELPASITNRLKIAPGEVIDYLPHQLLRKYIAYSQKYVHPVLCLEARQLLKEFYLKLRKDCQLNNGSPITTRQLQSLLRLTQARAKIELREEAPAADAIDVIEIMKHSFIDSLSDEFGVLDFHRSQHGSGISKQSEVNKVLSVLQRKADSLKKSLFSLEELKRIVEDTGIPKQNFYNILEKLNFHGYLLKKSAKAYQLTSVDYS